jgi:hypothetical protein
VQHEDVAGDEVDEHQRMATTWMLKKRFSVASLTT